MKQHFQLISAGFLYFILAGSVFAQTDLGVGLVSLGLPENSTVRFYARSSDRSPAKTLEFFHDKSTNSRSIRDLEKQSGWFSPELWGVDDNPLLFRCKSRTSSGFEVIVNNDTGKTYWIKQSRSTRFMSWGKYLRDMFAIERDKNFGQKIYSAPRTSSNEINYQGKDCFTVKSMRGDWIEITTPDYCHLYTESKTKIKSGWIKWRKGNELMIYLFHTA